MTKISGLILETQALNAISNIDTIMAVQSSIKDKNHELFHLLEKLKEESEKMSLGIVKQV